MKAVSFFSSSCQRSIIILSLMGLLLSGCLSEFQLGSTSRPHTPESAGQSLKKWRELGAGSQNSVENQEGWFHAASSLPPTAAIKEAGFIYGDSARPGDFRSLAAMILIGRQWPADESAKAISLIRKVYPQVNAERRAAWEKGLLRELRYMAGPTLDDLYSRAPTGVISFPWSIILLEKARREANNPSFNPAAVIGRINAPGIMADPALIKSTMNASKETEAHSAKGSFPISAAASDAAPQYNSSCVVLALSASGPYSPFASRISLGADAARRELAGKGVDIKLEVLDSESPDWLERLKALPPSCAIVGGPMKAQSFNNAQTAGLTTQRVFFTFLPQLEGSYEGTLAWRFYTAPEDQILALLRFTGQDMMIKDYGMFYPGDSYGLRMAGFFERLVSSYGGKVTGVSYLPSQTADLTKPAGQLLNPRMINNSPAPTAAFKAVFLPDSWKNMEMITSSFLFNGEDHQILMGTALWEQGLAGRRNINMSKYELAIFPGAWNSSSPAAREAAKLGVSDFWTGLGYDFVRFAAAMNLHAYASPSEVNAKIAHAQNIAWAIAPLRWNDGRASQSMFLFTPSSEGFRELNPEAFKQRYSRALAKFNNKLKTLESSAQ